MDSERPLCCHSSIRFSSIKPTRWRFASHTRTIIVYLSYITFNLFIFEYSWSVFHINQHFSNIFSYVRFIIFVLFPFVSFRQRHRYVRVVCTRYLFLKAHFPYIHNTLQFFYDDTRHRRQDERYKILVFCEQFLTCIRSCAAVNAMACHVRVQTTASRLFVVFLSFINLLKWTKCKHMETLYERALYVCPTWQVISSVHGYTTVSSSSWPTSVNRFVHTWKCSFLHPILAHSILHLQCSLFELP